MLQKMKKLFKVFLFSLIPIYACTQAYATDCEGILFCSIEHHDALDEVAYLLKNGANPNETNSKGETPLMHAAMLNAPKIAEILIEHGADTDIITETIIEGYSTVLANGMTALMFAAKYNAPEVAEILIKNGADMGIISRTVIVGSGLLVERGMTALMFAAKHDNPKVLETLLDNGAYVRECAYRCNTALYYAADANSPYSAKILLDRGADALAQNDIGWSSDFPAILDDHLEVFQVFHNYWGDLYDFEGPDYESYLNDKLATAAKYSCVRVIQFLIDAGADIHARGKDGRTALLNAAYGGANKAITVLAENGADLYSKDNEGNDAMHYALVWLDRGSSDMENALYLAGYKDKN